MKVARNAAGRLQVRPNLPAWGEEMITSDMTVLDVSKLEGVVDLALPIRAKFSKALIAEAAGDLSDAYRLLDEAIALEAKSH